jgi:hypothetical protein
LLSHDECVEWHVSCSVQGNAIARTQEIVMPKHLATQMTRAVTFAALCLALLVPAAPSYAGCPVCAIIKTTPAGRAVPDDNDLRSSTSGSATRRS